MVSQCINPDCRAEFDVLSPGDLYAYERRSADTEFFWLCSACAARYDLSLEAAGRVTLRARGTAQRGLPTQAGGKLRLVTRSRQSTSRLQTEPSNGRAGRFAEGAKHLGLSR